MLVNLTNNGGVSMCETNIYDLKANLSKYIDLVAKGEEKEVVICKYNKKIAKIVLYEEEQKKPRLGCAKGVLKEMSFELKKGFEDIPELFGY